MFKVTREISFCYGHRLLNYSGKCKNLHGHNGVAAVTIEAQELDELGMVTDFSEIKTVVSTWIDENLDHRLLLCKDDPYVELLQATKEPVFVMDVNPTAENIARLIFHAVADLGVSICEIKLWETPSCYATYSRSGMVNTTGGDHIP
jgi:6-pyruvoyltetrahydropterin/6-carboxytetrahydropterin synthase